VLHELNRMHSFLTLGPAAEAPAAAPGMEHFLARCVRWGAGYAY